MRTKFIKILAIILTFCMIASFCTVNAETPAGETYDTFDEITLSDLELNPGMFENELPQGGHTYSAESASHSVVIKFEWKIGALTTSGWLLTFDKDYNTNAGVWFRSDHIYFGYNNSDIASVLSSVTVGTHGIEFGRKLVTSGTNTGKYYVYLSIDDDVVASGYTSEYTGSSYNSGNGMQDKIYILGTDFPSQRFADYGQEEETYDTCDEITLSDLGLNPGNFENALPAGANEYTATSTSNSVAVKFQWQVGDITDAGWSVFLDGDGKYDRAAWFRSDMIVFCFGTDFAEMINSGYTTGTHEVEFGRKLVISGQNKDKYYIYLIVDNALLASAYTTFDNMTDKIAFNGGELSSQRFADYGQEEETYDTYDVITLSDLGLNPGNYENALSPGAREYAATSTSNSVAVKFKWQVGDISDKGWSVFLDDDGKYDRGVWFRSDMIIFCFGKDFEKRINPGYTAGTHDVEFGRKLVISGQNRDKYYIYLIVDDTLLASAYTTFDNMTDKIAFNGGELSTQRFADDNAPRANLISFRVEGQIGEADINGSEITVTVPYENDETTFRMEATCSVGAVMVPSSGSMIDFSNGPVILTVTNGSVSNQWTVRCVESEKQVLLKSDNATLMNGFNWAVSKAKEFVVTGQTGQINNGTSPDAAYIPSYWAGYKQRTAFYIRDFVHQAAGAALLGLNEENYSMFNAFAKTANESRKWYAVWALNFDGSVYYVDYKSDTNFVREVPANFELVEKAYEQYLMTGDSRYISDEMFDFYTKVMTDFVALHDTNNNGIAEGTGQGIFNGTCTYNESSGVPLMEAGDGIGAQYQATLAYAGFLRARGDEQGAQQWEQKAADLKTYFNTVWGVMPGDENGNYVRGLSTDGVTRYNDFANENTNFMPLKMITEPGEKNDNYLDFIDQHLGEGAGTNIYAPVNIEAYTYIPDMFFLYNRNNDAWKWMKYILNTKDDPHQAMVVYPNGDYPEVSFTIVSQTVEGMMGVSLNVPAGKLSTVPRLPDEVGYVTLKYEQLGNNEINLTHNGNTESTITNNDGAAFTWKAQFYGNYDYISVNGQRMEASHGDINGEAISYVEVTVGAGETVTAIAGETVIGDVNCDGTVDIRDLVHLKKAAAGLVSDDEDLCDLNDDHIVDANDLTALRKILLGIAE